MLERLRSRPIRTVLRWQVIATLAMAVPAGILAGRHGALSALLGGSVSMLAGVGFAVVSSLTRADSAGSALLAVLRAEAAKIALIVILLWLVMTTYDNVVTVAFFGSFAITVVIFAMAVSVPDD